MNEKEFLGGSYKIEKNNKIYIVSISLKLSKVQIILEESEDVSFTKKIFKGIYDFRTLQEISAVLLQFKTISEVAEVLDNTLEKGQFDFVIQENQAIMQLDFIIEKIVLYLLIENPREKEKTFFEAEAFKESSKSKSTECGSEVQYLDYDDIAKINKFMKDLHQGKTTKYLSFPILSKVIEEYKTERREIAEFKTSSLKYSIEKRNAYNNFDLQKIMTEEYQNIAKSWDYEFQSIKDFEPKQLLGVSDKYFDFSSNYVSFFVVLDSYSEDVEKNKIALFDSSLKDPKNIFGWYHFITDVLTKYFKRVPSKLGIKLNYSKYSYKSYIFGLAFFEKRKNDKECFLGKRLPFIAYLYEMLLFGSKNSLKWFDINKKFYFLFVDFCLLKLKGFSENVFEKENFDVCYLPDSEIFLSASKFENDREKILDFIYFQRNNFTLESARVFLYNFFPNMFSNNFEYFNCCLIQIFTIN